MAHASLPGVDAVFAASDAHAIGFMAGLRTAGLLRSGPAHEQPVAVIGLGDLEMGRLISPSLSTIGVHGREIGGTAATLTLERHGERCVDIGFELLLRESGCPRSKPGSGAPPSSRLNAARFEYTHAWITGRHRCMHSARRHRTCRIRLAPAL